MPTPFPFVSGSVLQAAQLNAITELPTRTLTSSGAAVAADSYSRVILNGTSITYTINTSTFSAGQVVELYNANSTTATIAAGAGITLNTASTLTLAQYQTAQLYAVSATSFVLSPSTTGIWAAYTPTLTNITQGNGTMTARYTQIGKFVMVKFRFVLGSTSSIAAVPGVSLPVTADTTATYNQSQAGWVTVLDSGTDTFSAMVSLGTSTRMDFYLWNVSTTFPTLNNMSATAPMTWTTNDALTAMFFYEAA